MAKTGLINEFLPILHNNRSVINFVTKQCYGSGYAGQQHFAGQGSQSEFCPGARFGSEKKFFRFVSILKKKLTLKNVNFFALNLMFVQFTIKKNIKMRNFNN